MGFKEKYLKRVEALDELKAKQLRLKDELNIAYEYKESIISKTKFADKQISDKQQEYHNLFLEVQTELSKIKIDMDLEWVG